MDATRIINADIFDGENLIQGGAVTFENGVIVETAANATEIDASGCTVLPALIDSHVHLYGIDNLKVAAKYGIGTMCDMASRDPQTINVLRNLDGLPHILTACRPAFAPGSKMPVDLKYPESCWVKNAGDAARFVNEQIAAGSDYIKVILEEPRVPGQVAFPQEILSAIVTNAHENVKKVIAHSVSPAHFDLCANIGIDVITHIPFFRALSAETVELLARKQPTLVPTVGVMKGIVKKIKRKNPFLPFGYKHVKKSVSLLREAGIPMLAGTDANMGDPTTPCEMPYGASLHAELALMAEAGFSNADALKSATSAPARYWGLHDRGRIAVGYRADLLLVDGNPVKNIKALSNIKRIWIGGKEINGS